MNAFVHRFIMFVAAVTAGFAGIAGLSDTAGAEVVSYLALTAAGATVVGTSWRILFPEEGAQALTPCWLWDGSPVLHIR